MGVDDGMPQLAVGSADVKQRGKGDQAGSMVVTGSKPVLVVMVDGEQLCQIAAFDDETGSRLASKILARMNARIAELEAHQPTQGSGGQVPASRTRDAGLGALVKDGE